MARPKYEITDDILKKVETLAAQGLNMAQIASVLHISKETIYRRQKECPELKEAIERGRDKGIGTVVNALFNKAKSGDNTAIIFWLKNRDPQNWNDRKDLLVGGDPDNPINASIKVIYE